MRNFRHCASRDRVPIPRLGGTLYRVVSRRDRRIRRPSPLCDRSLLSDLHDSGGRHWRHARIARDRGVGARRPDERPRFGRPGVRVHRALVRRRAAASAVRTGESSGTRIRAYFGRRQGAGARLPRISVCQAVRRRRVHALLVTSRFPHRANAIRTNSATIAAETLVRAKRSASSSFASSSTARAGPSGPSARNASA